MPCHHPTPLRFDKDVRARADHPPVPSHLRMWVIHEAVVKAIVLHRRKGEEVEERPALRGEREFSIPFYRNGLCSVLSVQSSNENVIRRRLVRRRFSELIWTFVRKSENTRHKEKEKCEAHGKLNTFLAEYEDYSVIVFGRFANAMETFVSREENYSYFWCVSQNFMLVFF